MANVETDYYEVRGTMVYTEETKPGKATFLAECATVEQAQRIVDTLNALAELAHVSKD